MIDTIYTIVVIVGWVWMIRTLVILDRENKVIRRELNVVITALKKTHFANEVSDLLEASPAEQEQYIARLISESKDARP